LEIRFIAVDIWFVALPDVGLKGGEKMENRRYSIEKKI